MREKWTCRLWQELANKKKLPLHEVMLEREREETGLSGEETIQELQYRLQVMEESLAAGIQEKKDWGGLVGQESGMLLRAIENENSLLGSTALKAGAYAMAIAEENASMGRVLAAPTAGASGIVPGVLFAVMETEGVSREQLFHGFVVAGGLGLVVGEKMEMSGAAGGCQAECGIGAGMAAGGALYALGAQDEAVFHGFALAIKNLMGLVCDPVAGLVEVPCIKRNAMVAVHAVTAVEFARAGLRSFIPPDEVIDAVQEVGDLLHPSLKETARGGLAATKTGMNAQRERHP